MDPGKELDALIAEKVMGGVRARRINQITNYDVSAQTITIDGVLEYPRYSTEIAAAWEVVQKLSSMGIRLKLREIKSEIYDVMFVERYRGVLGQSSSESVPHAICLAAVRALAG